MIYTWIDFYKKFSEVLLQFKNDRKALLDKIIKCYKAINLSLPTIDDGDPTDIDPFTVYALFNRQITEDNRKAIIKAFNEEFNVNASIPSDFTGLPVVNNMKTTFYNFSDEKRDIIAHLWKFYGIALNLPDDESLENEFKKNYDDLQKYRGIRWNLTMGLFWINPDYYISLDSRNRWFLSLDDHFDNNFIKIIKDNHAYVDTSKVPSGEEYIRVINSVKEYVKTSDNIKDLIDLSHQAWVVSEEVNQEEKNKNKKQIESLEQRGVHYWIYSPGPNASYFDEFYNKSIMAIGWDEIGNASNLSRSDITNMMKDINGDDKSYTNDSLCVYQFVNEMMIGDVIFAKKGMHEIIARGVVKSDYVFDATRMNYKHTRKVEWTHKGSWNHSEQIVMKALTDITKYKEYAQKLESMFEIYEEENTVANNNEYTEEAFLKDIYIDREKYHHIKNLLDRKKNIILQGAPGVGKSFMAKRLAYSIMNVADKNRVEVVQFHQSYSYEDFIMGYRPAEEGLFERKNGSFYNFCKKAEQDADNKYFFIIDEINRGNLSKIFGELFLLIEADKRDNVYVQLLYSDEKFSIPSNVYIIGTMNTADRSLAMMDYALRRRFSFVNIEPAFESDGFIKYQNNLDNYYFNRLIDVVKLMNVEIAKDESLGRGFMIGHSYFCNLENTPNLLNELSDIVEYEIIPLIEEYWFDEKDNVDEWSNKLRGALK